MALDLSVKKIGMAWGESGKVPEGTMQLNTAPDIMASGEGLRLAKLSDQVVEITHTMGLGFVIFSEFYSSQNMMALRANASLRGAVMAQLWRSGIEALPVAEITARKAAGVDISRAKPGEKKKGYMKGRARARLQELGLGYLSEDEGDAAILLLGSTAVIEEA